MTPTLENAYSISGVRKVVFANDQIYHVFNRTLERKPVFTSKRNCERAITALNYYRYEKSSLRLSKALLLEQELRQKFFHDLKKQPKLAEIVSYCLMPNHFHLLLKQNIDNGIPKYLSDFSNSFTRYFNTKRNRIGPLFQGVFKAVRIETDEQLIHASRYIHINPVVSFVIKKEGLDTYPRSSFPEYLNSDIEGMCDKEIVLNFFKSRKSYRKFVHDQADYAKKLKVIKHLLLEK